MSKKILSMLLVLTMLVGIVAAMPLTVGAAESDVWDGTYDTSFFTDGSGDGSVDDPFEISTPEHWYAFVKWSNKELTVDGVKLDDWYYFELTADLKFNEGYAAEWAAGTSTPKNKNLEPAYDEVKSGKWGVKFNGNGHTISGVYMNTGAVVGLFGNLWGNNDNFNEETWSLVENLIVENSYFYCSGGWVGSVLAETAGGTVVKNIYVKEDVYVCSGGNVAGGIIGGAYHTGPYTVTVNDCIFAGTVRSSGSSNGGIIGSGNSSSGKLHHIAINNCLVTGSVSGTETSNGFVGSNSNSASTTITNSIYAGKGFTNYPFAIGTATGSTVTVSNCYTTQMGTDDKAYITKKSTASANGVTEVTVADLTGLDAIDVTGFRKLEGMLLMPRGVASLLYPADSGIVTFKDWDGTVLQEKTYEGGDLPVYEGVTPTRPSTQFYDYEFAGWDPTIVTVDGPKEYVATYTNSLKVEALEEVDGKYVINNVNQYLYFMQNASDYSGETVVLGADLDFEGTEGILEPITGFAGTFDGDGKTISNIDMSGSGEIGLFGDTGTNELTIQDLTIRSSTFATSKNWVGTLISSTKSSNLVVKNIYVASDVKVSAKKSSGNSYAGGLIGGVYGTDANLTVENCIFAGTVEGTGWYVASIIGNVADGNNVVISNCLNAGFVNGADRHVAGIATSNGGTIIENCVNAGIVSANEDATYVAGIAAGNAKSEITINDCYSIRNIADIQISSGGVVTEDGNCDYVKRESLKDMNSLVELDGWTKVDGDFTMPNGAKDYVTETLYEYIEVEYPAALRGTGTEEDPFLVADADEWLLIMDQASKNDNYSGKYVKLENDIDFDGVELEPFSGFAGTLDGNGKVLKNIYMTKASGKGDVALFDALGDNATVKNFSIVSSTFEIKGKANWIGTVACCTNAENVTISGIYVDKDVKVIAGKADGNSIAGGILGGVYGGLGASVVIENCVFAGTVSGTGDNVAGIIASVEQKTGETDVFNTVTVRNCLNVGTVVGNDYVAGIAIGQGMTIENCVNAGVVRANDKLVGAIAVTNPNTSVVIDGCYYTNGKLLAVGDRGDRLVEYGANTYVEPSDLTGRNAKVPATFTKRAGDYAVPAGCDGAKGVLFAGLTLLDGASIRISDPSGLRFTAVLGGAYLNTFEGQDITFGIIIAPKDYVDAAGEFTVEALKLNGLSFKEIEALKLENDPDADESYMFSCALAPIQEGNYNRDFAAIAYIKVDGVYYYSEYDEEYNARSISEVAEKAYADTNHVKTAYYQYPLDVMEKEEVDGTLSDVNKTVYSPYTTEQRELLMSFYRDGDAINLSFLSYNIRNIEDEEEGYLWWKEENPTFEYDGREEKVLTYLKNYGADVIGLQEVSTINKNGGSADWLAVLNREGNGLTANGYTCVYGKNLYWGEDYSESLVYEHEKTMYNPIYYKTDKFNCIASGTKWLTSTPDLPSRIHGMDTWKGLTYVVLEEIESGEQFVYVNLHYVTKAEINNKGEDRQYVYDTDGNRTEIWAQQLETIYLRAILDDLQNEYDLPMFISGDFNHRDYKISEWFEGSYLDVETQIVSSVEQTSNGKTRYKDQIVAGEAVLTEKPEGNDETVEITFAGDVAHYTTGTTVVSSNGGGNFTNLGSAVTSKNVIDLWFISNFDGIVHTYEIIDNKFEELNAAGNNDIYPSDHLPAKLYVTLYID